MIHVLVGQGRNIRNVMGSKNHTLFNMKKLTQNIKQFVRLYCTGFVMGTADLIPGVSGGTIAFLSGIYEELLYSIRLMSGDFIKMFLRGRFREAFALVPFQFLVPLVSGILSAIFMLAQVIAYLLEEYPVLVWAFFFGLVLASTVIVLRRVVVWDLSDRISFVIAGITTYIIVGAIPIETPSALWFVFVSGMIAICAMILPGISGSFILLLLGKYDDILIAVTDNNFFILGVFAAGCIVGLSLFARLLLWLFLKHHDISVAILAGIMLGSVRKIWPWQEIIATRIDSHGSEVPVIVRNILPSSFGFETVFAITLIFLGYGVVLWMERMHFIREQVSDVEDLKFTKEHRQALEEEKH